jgi:hypothetical protein
MAGEALAADDKQNPKDKVSYWLRWIKQARKAADIHKGDSRAAWAEYEKKTSANGGSQQQRGQDDVERCYPAYWSASKVIEPAYYSRTPEPSTEVEFDWQDEVAETAAMMAERIGRYQIRTGNFDAVMSAAVQDFIHADKATIQIVCDIDDEGGAELPLAAAQDGKSYLTQDGKPHPGEVFKRDDGSYFGKAGVCNSIKLVPAPYDEYLHTPDAKIWSDVREMTFYFCLPYEEGKEKFPKVPDAAYKMGSGQDGKSDGSKTDNNGVEPIGRYLEGYECWDKESGTVYFVSESYPIDFLADPKPDPYGLPDFFPCAPFIIGSKPSKSLYPTPAYIQVLPTLKQLHLAYSRTFKLLRSARRRAIVDGASPDLINALNDLDENEFVAAQNLNDIVSKGGLDKMIFFVPVADLVSAISELQGVRDTFKAEFYEFFGVPDIIRGVSDPIETLGVNEMKRDAAHDRFRYAKKQVAQLARDGLQMLVHMALRLYDDQKLMKICGYQFMRQEQQQAFPAALAVLRDNEEQVIRLDIETDSIAFIDQRMRMEQRGLVIKTITDGLEKVSSMVQINPAFAVVSLQILLATLDGMEGGKYFIEETKSAGQKLIDAVENPPQQQPPPDYEMMKIQLQTRQQDWKEQHDSELLQLKAATEAANQEAKAQLVEIQGLKVQNDAQVAATAQALDQSKEQFKQVADSMLIELEHLKTTSDIHNRSLEEQRLEKQQKLDAMQGLLDQHAQAAQIANQRISMATDHIAALTEHINAKKEAQHGPTSNLEAKPTNKIHKVLRDSSGKISHLITTTEL